MDTLLGIGLSNALLATVLALIAAGLTRCCRRPALAHALWLLVLLKLLTPPLVRVRLPWPASPPPAVAGPEAFSADPDLVPLGMEGVPGPDAVPAGEDVGPPPEEAVALPAPGFPWKETAAGVWLAGALGWWLLAGVRLVRFRRMLGALARPAPDEVVRRAEELAGRLGLRRCPSVWMVPANLSPMLLALGRSPRLLLPEALWARLTAGQRDTLLLHELAHLRRGDHRVRRLELLALGLYWWHPVAWWCRRRLQEAEEECCDAWVVWALPGSAAEYASALVETVAFLSRPAVPVGASGLGQVPLLKRRLTMILGGLSRRTLSWVGLGMVFGLGALVLPLMPILAGDPSPPAVADFVAHPGHDVLLWSRDLTVANSCTACHQPGVHGVRFVQKKQAWEPAHQEVLRLMAEVKAQRARLQQSEDRLRLAIEKLQSATRTEDPPGDSAAKRPAKRPTTSEQRLKSLEQKLDALLRDVDALRKEMKPRKEDDKDAYWRNDGGDSFGGPAPRGGNM